MRSRLLPIVVPALLLFNCGDKKRDSETQSTAGNTSTKKPEEKAKPKAKPSQRLSMRRWRALLQESMRAELRAGGLGIDFGSTDQHKYTRGGWASGWGEIGQDSDGSSFASKAKGSSTLSLVLDNPAKELVVRARGKGSLELTKGKKSIGKSEALQDTWSELRIPLNPEALEAGRHRLGLKSSAAVEIDWMWIRTDESVEGFSNLPRTLPIKFGASQRRALTAPSSRTLSYYLHLPPSAKLIVDTGSDVEASFKIVVHTLDGKKELLSTKATEAKWSEQVVDLSSLANQPLRLDFITESKLGKTGWGEPEIVIPKGKSSPPSKKAKNLVYVVMDTTRADAFASVNPDTDVQTPHYDSIAKKATTFANASNNENWTKPSVVTMWSSLYPGTHGAREATSKVDKTIRFLPEELKDAGFSTGAFIANAVVGTTFGFDRGWTHFQNDSDHSLNGNGSRLYPNAAKWMQEHKDERFFLYVQSVDPHTTYEVPENYSAKYFSGKYSGPIGDAFDREEQIVVDNGKMKISERDLSWIWALYKGEVSYQDKYLGGLLKTIEDLGLMEDTLIVLTNDHGEEIKDHGSMGHGWPLFEEQIRAPLLMKFDPVFRPGASVKAVVEHVDLTPTILDTLGLPPMKSAEGLSLLPYLEDGIGKRQHPFTSLAWSRKGLQSIRVGDYKLIVGKSSGWRHLYDLKADPKEKSNWLRKGEALDSKTTLVGRLCEIYLGEAMATPNKAKRLDGSASKVNYSSPEIPVDDKMRRELEALGYL